MKSPSAPFDPTTFLEKRRIEKKIQQDGSIHSQFKGSVSELLPLLGLINPKIEPSQPGIGPGIGPSKGLGNGPLYQPENEPNHENVKADFQLSLPTLAPSPPPVVSLYEHFERFLDHLVLEQLKKPESLLKLNPSRRDSLGRFLSELCRLPEPYEPQEALRRFIRVDRSETEHEAIKQLFKQIALAVIGKALLLRNWNVQAGHPLHRADMKDLTSAVERGLRPFIHLQTTTVQLIQQNFYSWYKLDERSQTMLWDLLEQVRSLDEAKDWFLNRAIRLSAETLGERDRYSKMFYQNLWRAIQRHHLLELRFPNHYGFSPSLRDGSFMENAPSQINWIGFEPLTFELMLCEIRYLWNRPKNPPLWLKGSGLEMSMEQQSSMLLTHSGKQNMLQQIDSISSCEIAIIAEESLIRTQSRSMAGQALRNQVDAHTILKRLKQPSTTRGMYQSCQALEKLRQGGLLIWAREELLTEAAGKPALQYILNQAKILLIADLSALECGCSKVKRDLPKALYILQKEGDLETRKSHRPIMIKTYGSIKSQEEVEILFDRVMSLVRNPEQVFPLEPFQIHARVSPMDQREWEQHWFNPADDQLVDRIEDLKRNATPLGQLVVVRSVHPSIDHVHTVEPSLFGTNAPGTQASGSGFYAWVESSKNGNEIYTAELHQLPDYMRNSHTLFWITPFNARWSAPLQILIRSQLTRDWFNYSVERKKGAWILRETDLKAIPIPRHLSQVLTAPEVSPVTDHPIVNMVPTEPGQALRALENLGDRGSERSEDDELRIKALSFISAAQILHQLESHQSMLFSLVSPDEQIIYPKFFKTVMQDTEMSSIAQHPMIRFTPTLTPHLAIHQISPINFPTPGILLTTAKGLTQQLYIQDTWLRERCQEALRELNSQIAEPTWSEITHAIRLPKNPTQAQAMGLQILKAYAQEKMKRKELNHLIGACLLNSAPSQSKLGLLQ